MSNHPDVEALRKVDDLDTRIRKLKSDIADLPSDLNKHKAKQKATMDLLAAVHAQQKHLEKEIHKLGVDTKSNEDQIKKYQVQQNTAKTNEEYSTLKKQIDALKKANGDLDDKVLAHYEKIDVLKADEATAKKAVKEAEGSLKAEEIEVQKEIASLQQKLGELMAERTAAEAGIAAHNLALYRSILQKLDGRALAAIHNRTCQGCFMEISPNTLSSLLGGKELMQCKACARINYLEKDYRANSPMSYLVTEKDRDSTSKDGNW